ncbi:MAG: SDR family oxidoreductase [Bryobacteraceae bacterium]
MKHPFENKVAVVTGATRGIGRAIAERLLGDGANVAICGRSQDTVSRAVEEMAGARSGKIIGQAADLTRLDDVRAFFRFVEEKFGGVDCLVNNAGIGIFRNVEELAPEEWHAVIGLNLTGVYYCCHMAIPLMLRRGGGYIIQISSLAGKNAIAGGAAYNASKFGVNGFSEAMMLDLRYKNIRVSYLMPGSVNTEFSSRSGAADWKIAPDDVAEVVSLLLRMPERTLVSRVEVRPSQPKR